MNLSEIQLIDFLKSDLQVPFALDRDSKLFSTGELDSVSMLELITFVEKQAHIQVRPEDVTLDNFDSVSAIFRFINDQL